MIYFKTKLTSSTIKLKELDPYIGKEVEIIVKEVSDNHKTHHWKHSGSVNLQGRLDKTNIRDLAHE